MVQENIGILISFILYLFCMILIGWFFFSRTSNLSDYLLGGRGLNSWVTSLSAQASDMSGWLLLGLPGYAYLAGLEAGWIALGLFTGTYINWKVVARRLRKYTEIAGNSLTLPDYFSERFKSDNHLLRIISAVFILVFFLIYTSSGFVAGAKLFSTVFGLSYFWALVIGVLVIISYTFLGGFMAVSWTDFVQGIIMFIAIILIPGLAVWQTGGFNATFDQITEINPHWLSFSQTTEGVPISAIVIISSLAWGLGYFGQPHILARFMAIRHSSQIKKARRVAIVWVAVSLICAVFIGMLGNLVVEQSLQGDDAETVFMLMIEALVHPLFSGIILSAILAAIMSTADSQLLVTSSAISEDIYRVLIKKDASDRDLLWVSRASVLVVAIVAFIIALNPESSVLELVAYAWAGFGASFGPLILFSLFWKRMTYKAAISGVLSGGITVLLWKQLNGGLFELYEIVPGFLLSCFCIVLVSWWDRPPSKQVIREFESIETIDI
ncbi:MAG: sodium/proline symporter PutP [Candidatus Cyclobacteriaceae bacterium M3_2C_046]